MLDIYQAMFLKTCKIETKLAQCTRWVVHNNFAFRNDVIYPSHNI